MLYVEFAPGETIAQYLNRTGMLARMGRQPFALTIDGRRLPRALWARCRPRPGTIIGLHAVVRGGGGGGGKNPLATIAMIALMVYAAPVAAGALGASAGGALGVSAAVGGHIVTAGTLVLGGLAINRLFPPPRVAAPSLGSESPTYAIDGGSNRMRRYEPMPKICGEQRVLPDFGAQPYTEFEGEEQVGYYVFDYGYNDVVLSDHRIGATPLTSFPGYTIEESGPSGALTLFPGNVDTVAGAALEPSVAIERTGSAGATRLAVDVGGIAVLNGTGYDANGSPSQIGLQVKIQYRLVGAGVWTDLAYGAATATGVAALGSDEVSQGSGVVFFPGTKRAPVKRSFTWLVASGQYEVRVERTTPAYDDPHVADLAWTQLRSYQPDTGDYTGRKRVALKIRASQLASGTLEQFSSYAQARCQVWNGSTFEQAITSNPAWWFLDAARGQFVGGRRTWGGGLVDSRIDIEGLKAFGAWCVAEGLTFDWVFDQQVSVYEMLSTIVLMGRATPSWGTGKLGVVWDAADQNHVAVFGMHNIVGGSFEIDYATEDLAEVIEGWYRNPDLDDQRDFVRVTVPGAASTSKVRRVELVGCRNQTLAAQLTNLYAANNAYRTRRYRWKSDWEGMPASRGDVVLLSHDLASLDYSGRFVEGGDNSTLKLPKSVPLFGGGSFVIIRKPNHQFKAFAVQGGTGDTDTLELVAALTGDDASYNPYAHPTYLPYDFRWHYGPSATPGKKVKIEAFKPVSHRLVELSAIDERPEYYAAKNGDFTFVPPQTVFGAAPDVSGLAIAVDGVLTGNGYLAVITATWDASGDYGFADVRASVAGGPLALRAQDVRGRRAEFNVPDRTTVTVEVTAYSSLGRLGQSTKLTLTEAIDFAAVTPPADVTGFSATVTPYGIVLAWNEVPDIDRDLYEVWRGASFGSGTRVFLGKVHEHTDLPKLSGTYDYYIKAIDVAKKLSVNAVTAQVVINAIAAPAVSGAVVETDAVLSWVSPSTQFAIDTFEVRHGASFAAGVPLGKTKATTLKTPVDWVGSRTFWVVAIDVAGNVSAAGSAAVNVAVAATPVVSVSVDGSDIKVAWSAPLSTLPIVEYEVRHGATFAGGTVVSRVKGTAMRLHADFGGERTYWVAAVDSRGNLGDAGGSAITIVAPTVTSLVAEVIDNTVLLRWSTTAGTLPIATHNVYRNDVLIGSDAAQFAVIFESAAGSYTYKVTPIDSAGNLGTFGSKTAVVSQPPDFVLFDRMESAYAGTKTNGFVDPDTGALLVNINTTETIEQHFTARGWAGPQDQIDAGYPLILVGKTTGSYEEKINYGTIIPSTKVTMTPTEVFESGAVTVTPKLSTSPDDSAYTDFNGVYSTYSSAFQYVKYRMDFTAAHDGTGLADDTSSVLAINPLVFTLDVKLKTAQGVVTCNSGDAGGTVVDISSWEFIDVHAIVVTPLATAARHATYDFVDAPNPTEFSTFLWNTAGARQSGDASYTVRGV